MLFVISSVWSVNYLLLFIVQISMIFYLDPVWPSQSLVLMCNKTSMQWNINPQKIQIWLYCDHLLPYTCTSARSKEGGSLSSTIVTQLPRTYPLSRLMSNFWSRGISPSYVPKSWPYSALKSEYTNTWIWWRHVLQKGKTQPKFALIEKQICIVETKIGENLGSPLVWFVSDMDHIHKP